MLKEAACSSLDHKDRCFLKERSKAAQEKMGTSSSFGAMLENVRHKALELGLWCDEMQRDLPKKWEKHGNMVVFPQDSFQHINWRFIGRELWKIVAESLEVDRLGRKRLIANDSDRTPHVDILYGEHGWVEHTDERGIRYVYDASKKVFDISKCKEMTRISKIDAHGETVVNIMSGLGYFAFPWVATSGAKHVHALDWDEDSCEALKKTATANGLEDSVTVIEGDARRKAPQGVGDRVYLGILPSSKAHWMTACKCVKEKGGWIHIQELVDPKRKPLERTDSMKKTERKLSKLESIDEQKPTGKAAEKQENGENGKADQPNGKDEAPKLRRKLSRSASIVEEIENKMFPPPTIHPDFLESWARMQQHIKDFTMELAESCCRFMNNINVVDGTYSIEIRNVITLRARTTAKPQDHIVVDLYTTLHLDEPQRPRRNPRRWESIEASILDEMKQSDELAKQKSTEEDPR